MLRVVLFRMPRRKLALSELADSWVETLATFGSNNSFTMSRWCVCVRI